MTQFEYVVIGAGSAGCVVANRLTEAPDTTVLLLEAGNPDTKPEIQIPLDCPLLLGSEVDWGYLSEPEPYLNDRRILCSRGKVLGGSSSINFMYYVRGNPQDYDRWQAFGNPGWNYQDVLPYFKKSEHQQRGTNAYHSVDGELSVTDVTAPTAISQRFVKAALALGYAYNSDFNATQQEGAGSYQFTIKDGKRHSAAAAFLVPILQRPNLTVTTGALVTRLLFEATRVVGVEYQHEGVLHQVRVNQEVILSAGTFDSPKLLLRSGIGNAEQLQALGIAVVADLPGVGQNLQDHILVTVAYQATQDLHPVSTSSVGETGLFLRSEESSDGVPDLQFFFCPLPLPLPGYTQHERTFTGVVCLTHPQNIGRVGLRSANAEDAPMIQMNYLQQEADARKLVAGIKVVRKLFHSSALDEFRGEEIGPGVEVQTDEALMTYIRKTANTVWHPVGTCKMGTDPMAVVDPELRVHGVEGLRVVDASIMPTLTTGNINAPTIMIGEKAADLIKAVRCSSEQTPQAIRT